MKKIINYRIETSYGPNPDSLMEEVQNELRMGWQPFGSPFVLRSSKEPGGATLCQAMVLYEEGFMESLS